MLATQHPSTRRSRESYTDLAEIPNYCRGQMEQQLAALCREPVTKLSRAEALEAAAFRRRGAALACSPHTYEPGK